MALSAVTSQGLSLLTHKLEAAKARFQLVEILTSLNYSEQQQQKVVQESVINYQRQKFSCFLTSALQITMPKQM
jgi:hypothetical protein